MNTFQRKIGGYQDFMPRWDPQDGSIIPNAERNPGGPAWAG
jgi:hypothetical protein